MNNFPSVTTPAGVVGVAVQMLGFTPASSICLMLLHGNALSASLRVDANPASPARHLARQVGEYARLDTVADRSILISFEDDKAMTVRQYEAIGDALAAEGMPLQMAILVAGGHIMDYDGDSTDAVPFSAALTSPTAMALHMDQDKPLQLASDIPACADPEMQGTAVVTHAANAALLDTSDEETRARTIGTLTDIVDGYTANDVISADHAAWIGGSFTSSSVRDVLAASLSTSESGEDAMGAALLGQSIPESWDYLRNAGRTLYAALEFIPEQMRADTLSIIGWTRWLDGQSSQAAAFFALALEAEPGHRLAQLFTTMVQTGRLSTAARTRH